jgi:hypothetical protein
VLARNAEDSSDWEVWIRAPNGVFLVAIHCDFHYFFPDPDDDPEGLRDLLG